MKRKSHSFFTKIITAAAAFLIFTGLTSCVSTPKKQKHKTASINLTDSGVFTAEELARYFISKNPFVNEDYILNFAQTYIQEAQAEGINSDIAFAQMCLETGHLNFGNLVQPEFHNYCGLGAMDAEHPGEVFPNEKTGIRAHIQHLHAYATTEDVSLNQELVDPRYSWPHKTRHAKTFYELAGTWAMDMDYGKKIENILQNISVLTHQ